MKPQVDLLTRIIAVCKKMCCLLLGSKYSSEEKQTLNKKTIYKQDNLRL